MKYVNENVIGKLNDKLEVEKEKPQTNETIKAINGLEKDIKEAEAQDALASTIINKNVSQEVLNYIRYFTFVYDIMEKLKKKKKKNNIKLGTWEKIRVIYLSYPKILRDLIHPSGTEMVDSFLEESIKKINFTYKDFHCIINKPHLV